MEQHKWDSPYHWLSEKMEEWTIEEVRQALRSLALQAGGDEIQDLFESEMTEDGYFHTWVTADSLRKGDVIWYGGCAQEVEDFTISYPKDSEMINLTLDSTTERVSFPARQLVCKDS